MDQNIAVHHRHGRYHAEQCGPVTIVYDYPPAVAHVSQPSWRVLSHVIGKKNV